MQSFFRRAPSKDPAKEQSKSQRGGNAKSTMMKSMFRSSKKAGQLNHQRMRMVAKILVFDEMLYAPTCEIFCTISHSKMPHVLAGSSDSKSITKSFKKMFSSGSKDEGTTI